MCINDLNNKTIKNHLNHLRPDNLLRKSDKLLPTIRFIGHRSKVEKRWRKEMTLDDNDNGESFGCFSANENEAGTFE